MPEALKYKYIHNYKMACTAAHDKQVKDFMTAEVLMLYVKNRKLERIYDAACRIDDAACKEPQESGC